MPVLGAGVPALGAVMPANSISPFELVRPICLVPKKRPILNRPARGTAFMVGFSAVQDLTGHLGGIEPDLDRLGGAIAKYFRKSDPHRKRFMAIDALFRDWSRNLRLAIRRKARKADRQ